MSFIAHRYRATALILAGLTVAVLLGAARMAGAVGAGSATDPAAFAAGPPGAPGLIGGSGPGGGACGWRPSVVAPVTDPFRLPGGPYAAGNRGIEYGTGPGEGVRAVAAGRVELAGVVAGLRWVVVDHGHDLRSTYGPLAASTVAPGQAVAPGEVLGVTAGPVLVTARLGGRYIDPAPFLAGRCGQLRLVPPPPPTT